MYKIQISQAQAREFALSIFDVLIRDIKEQEEKEPAETAKAEGGAAA